MGIDGLDEHELWRLSLERDGRAFARIFDLHRDRVFRLALRLSGSADAAEDLTAMAFLELWRRRERVRVVDGSVLPWLLVTTSNVARNAARSARRHRRFLAALPHPEPVPDASAQVAASVELDDTMRSVQALPTIDRQLILLVAVEGLSLVDASAVLGLTYGAAKTRLSRARRRLANSNGSTRGAQVQRGGAS